jgi:hypothetical protein
MASGDTLAVFIPQANEPPSSNNATLDARNSILVLDFDPTTSESAIFRGVLPGNYSGGGLTLDIYWMATSATTGDVVWGGSIERAQSGGTDQDADSFATEQLSAAVTTNATSGIKNKSTITFTSGANMDSLAAGEPFRIKIARKPADAGDTMAGDAELTEACLKET